MSGWIRRLGERAEEARAMAPGVEGLVDEVRRLCDQESLDGPRVAAAGLLKAGKSTLLCALAGRREAFATSSIPCTRVEQAEAAGPLVLVDTPGTDFEEADEEVARRALLGADVVLAVHSVRQGELEAAEIEDLRRLLRLFPTAGLTWERIVPVLTRCDQVAPGELDGIERRILSQLRTHLHLMPPRVYRVSSLRHLDGLEASSRARCEASGVPSLLESLVEAAGRFGQRREKLIQWRLRGALQRLVEAVAAEGVRERESAEARVAEVETRRAQVLSRAEPLLQRIAADERVLRSDWGIGFGLRSLAALGRSRLTMDVRHRELVADFARTEALALHDGRLERMSGEAPARRLVLRAVEERFPRPEAPEQGDRERVLRRLERALRWLPAAEDFR